jgi:hypothetical protein
MLAIRVLFFLMVLMRGQNESIGWMMNTKEGSEKKRMEVVT